MPTGSPADRRRLDDQPSSRLVVASTNPGKIAELAELLTDVYRVERRPAGMPETVEDGETLEANAIKKAREVQAVAGAAALADDTGLFVTALGGRPGVRTARYAGQHSSDADNIAKLLSELQGVEDRRAEFRTVIALVDRHGSVQLATGAVAGEIALEPTGTIGFGYDPVFVPEEGDGRSFAQMSSAEKNRISHRARALRSLLEQTSQP